jgi:hypothetical protein
MKNLLKKLFLFTLRTLVIGSIVVYAMLVIFDKCGTPLRYNNIVDGWNNPHKIDVVYMFQTYWFPFLVTLSFAVNALFVYSISVASDWLSSGRMRVGGRAGND